MKTIFIGFTKRVGSFTSERTGELIDYSNRDLRFITDSGSNADNVGFKPYTAEKIKLKDLSSILNVAEDDKAVDTALTNLLNKPVTTVFAPKNDRMELVWFGAEKVRS